MGFSYPPLYDSWFQFIVSQLFINFFLIVACPVEIIHSFFAFRNIFRRANNWERHKKKVKRVQEEVMKWDLEGKPKGLKMCSGRKASESISQHGYEKKGYYQINIGDLKDIVEMDEKNQTLTVEPGMTMGRLTNILTEKGWTIPVVPELPTLTVGGLIAGAGLETSSHKYGLFHDTVRKLELVTPDGKVVECSENHDPDLFHAIPGSYGTLGFLTAVTLPIIPAGRYVKLEYHVSQNIKEAIEKILTAIKDDYDFIEGFAFSKDQILIMSGRMSGNFEIEKINKINAFYKPCFYQQAQVVADKLSIDPAETYYEYITLKDYYNRHTRGTFWLLVESFPQLKYEWLFILLGWAIPTDLLFSRSLFPKVITGRFLERLFVQDYVMESSKISEFFETCDNILGIYPVWLCPTKLSNEKTMFPSFKEMGIDIGYYGFPKCKRSLIPDYMKQLEQLTITNKGLIGLYADNFITKPDFSKMFKTEHYNKMRKERGCLEAFPDAWEKACQREVGNDRK